MVRFVLAFILASSSFNVLALKTHNPMVMDHSKETLAVFREFDKNKDSKLSHAEFSEFRTSAGDEPPTKEGFRSMIALADPEKESKKGAWEMSMDDYQVLVENEAIEGGKLDNDQTHVEGERKAWLGEKALRHGEIGETLKLAVVQNAEDMVKEIFTDFDTDSDGYLLVNEFNRLQEATEGRTGVYDAEQYKTLLDQADPDRAKEGLSFDILRSMYLDKSISDEFQTDLPNDYKVLLHQGKVQGTSLSEETRIELIAKQNRIAFKQEGTSALETSPMVEEKPAAKAPPAEPSVFSGFVNTLFGEK